MKIVHRALVEGRALLLRRRGMQARDVIVVGAGISGLACARALADAGWALARRLLG
jgi:ribulose 1,5-bisphosphate synthetase/thiazole synthase